MIFVEPGVEVYQGMIVGEHNRENDLVVNVSPYETTNKCAFSDERSNGEHENHVLCHLRNLFEYLNEDEYREVTPESIRLRKKILDKT
ncbi:hypothetical protein ACEQPO_11860 [Bacillus sp. SL00103]